MLLLHFFLEEILFNGLKFRQLDESLSKIYIKIVVIRMINRCDRVGTVHTNDWSLAKFGTQNYIGRFSPFFVLERTFRKLFFHTGVFLRRDIFFAQIFCILAVATFLGKFKQFENPAEFAFFRYYFG